MPVEIEMSILINERYGVADFMKSDLICTSNDWLDTQKRICSINAIYFEDNCGSSKVLQRNTEVWFKIMSQLLSIPVSELSIIAD